MTAPKTSLALLFFLVAHTSFAQPLFSYGAKQVSREEFLKAFNKNNTDGKPSSQSYKEYLDLYTRFKIKVQAALDMKLDTLSSQRAELKNFRSQVAANYMNDSESMNQLVEEAMKRSEKDIRFSHIYVQLPQNASKENEQKAREKINLAYVRLVKGEPFDKVAISLSEDPAVATNKGDIGFITAFTLPYDLENQVYNTAAGKFSKPYQTKIGFHIFKNTGERKAFGKIRVAQILLSFSPDATNTQKQQIALRADSLYRALQNGADFKELVQKFSTDNVSYQNGGEMQEFGTGRYESSFEAAAFALQKDGDMSKPFETTFGYHILKRIQVSPVVTDKNNKTAWDDYYQRVAENDRMEVSKKRLLKKILLQTGYKKFPVNEKSLTRITDSALAGTAIPNLNDVKRSTTLFSFPKQMVKVEDWISYLDAIRSVDNIRAEKNNSQLFDKFIETTALEYYRDNLETFNKEFAYQLKEFKEGNLLFEIMQRKIWDRASEDSAGLKNYYDQHKATYWWEASAEALILTATKDSIAKAAGAALSSGNKNWRDLVDKSEGLLLGDSGRFELGQLPVVEKTAFSVGVLTAPVKNESDNSTTFCYIIKMYSDKEPRNFNDARGFVINDYQGFLEEKWISELRKKYPIKIDETVLKNLPK